MWFSKKIKGPGLKYLVAIAIYSSNICFVDGPYPAGKNKNTVYKQKLLNMIPKEEPIEVDSGPKGDDRLMGPNVGLSQEF